jgi:arylsulfatase A-like enzyme
MRSFCFPFRLFEVPRQILFCALVCASSHGTEPGRPANAGPHPNIILILADDLGYGDSGCYGQTRIKTPNIDRLAAEGMKFTDFYAGSTVCAPSRCALMTGFHCGHARIRGNADVSLQATDLTVATALKKAGYQTALFGKWGLGEQNTDGRPRKQGFDSFVGFLNQTHAHDYYTDHLFRWDAASGFEGRIDVFQNAAGAKGLYIPDLFNTASTNFLKLNRSAATGANAPFFLFLAYTIPHANDEEGVRTGNGMQVPSDAPYSRESWPQVEKNKAAMITRMDSEIGGLLDKLKTLGLDENTLIFFSSDNGPHKEGGVNPEFFKSSGPFRGVKRDLYEGGIREPMIARWPKKIPAGKTNSLPLAFWDFFPTVAEIAGASTPTNLDGISFLPSLLDKPQSKTHDFLYWEFHERGFQQAARHGNWKALRPQASQPLELYDLSADPGEKNNIAAQHPEVIAQFEAYFRTARSEDPRWPIKPPPKKQNKKP